MKVALVHYWLVNMRGGEKVLEGLCRLYPQADIFTHVYIPENISPAIKQHTIITSGINRLPFAKKLYKHYLPLMPFALEQLDLRGYDLVISSESGPAKGVITDPDCLHVCYCHTPMRYLWNFYHQYLSCASPFLRPFMRYFFHTMRTFDVISSQRVDHFIANSHNVAKRIHKYYGRSSTVIHPPVNTMAFAPQGKYPEPEEYYLYLGQLVDYKRVDIAIQACMDLKRTLYIIGEGPERKKLQKEAGPNIHFLGHQKDSVVKNMLQRCQALLFPGEEDFGIVPLEAMAAGRPVLAYNRGGACETVVHGKTGLLFDQQSTDSLQESILLYEENKAAFVPSVLTQHSEQFSEETFARAIGQCLQQLLATCKNF